MVKKLVRVLPREDSNQECCFVDVDELLLFPPTETKIVMTSLKFTSNNSGSSDLKKKLLLLLVGLIVVVEDDADADFEDSNCEEANCSNSAKQLVFDFTETEN